MGLGTDLDPKRRLWEGVSYVAAGLGGLAALRLLEQSWRRWKGGDPPKNPASSQVAWSDALGWTIASGVAIGVARLLARRGATAAWRIAADEDPPVV